MSGECLKAAAHDLLEEHRERLILEARRALLVHLLANDTGTIDDVRAVVAVPDGINPKLFGPVPGPLAKLGIIAHDGYAKTARAAGHARPVAVWRLLDRNTALRWLGANPSKMPKPAAKPVAEKCEQFSQQLLDEKTP